MSIVIRLARTGRKNRPQYRVGVFDRRTRRDGPPIEFLGHYNPLEPDHDKRFVLQGERVSYWLGKGADISDTVRTFCKERGIQVPSRALAKRTDRKKRVVRRRARRQAS